MAQGGTEIWHQTLLPALVRSGRVQVVGYAVTNGTGDPVLLGVPFGLGDQTIRSLSRAVDVLVVWGHLQLGDLFPPRGDPRRPQTVLVMHGDGAMPWCQAVFRHAESQVDRLVGVASCAFHNLPPALESIPRTVIPNGVDPVRVRTRRTRAEVRQEFGVTPETVVCLGTHRLSGEKRLALLAEAVGRLGVPYRLVLAGDGAERASLEGRPGVTLLGIRSDIGDLLAGADLFVAASDFEGFGLSTAEAMAAGVPVISTPVGFLVDHPELARTVPIDAGPTEWAEAIRADWQDEAGRAARAERAQAFVRQHFSPDGFVRAWEDYLLGLPRPVALSQIAKPAPRNVPSPELPSPGRQVGGFLRSAAAVVATGLKRATPEEKARRLALCQACEFLRPDGRCGGKQGCGCVMEIKADFVATACPRGRW